MSLGVETPVVLVASVSSHDVPTLDRRLKQAGWDLVRVEDADEAVARLDGAARRAVLVIDSGLLEMPHDAQWRSFLTGHPELGTIVRRLGSRPGPSERAGDGTLAVHPDDHEGLYRAVRSFGAPRRAAG